MAKIKTIRRKIKDKQYDISINCNSGGKFSCKFPSEISNKVHVLKELELNNYNSLEELEGEISDTIQKYENANVKTRLVIAITFGARGNIARDKDKDYIKNLDPSFNGKFALDGGYLFNEGNVISFNYRILLEEILFEHKEFYSVNSINELSESYIKSEPEHHKIDGFIATRKVFTHTNEIIIDYSPKVLKNLESIEDQFRNAVLFLSKLLDQNNLKEILSNEIKKIMP